MPRSIYLDHASSMPLRPAARAAMLEALDAVGDPHRPHRDGREARRLLERARERVAAVLAAQPEEIVFTSGGTESVGLALLGAARANRDGGTRAVTTAVEHASVLGAGQRLRDDGFEVAEVGVDEHGRADLDRFLAEVSRPGTILASVQHANNEVGTMQPLAEAARLARQHGALIHTDACQTTGRLPVDVGALGVDLLSLSGHKFGGPPGAGALYVRRGVDLAPVLGGDDRERGLRPGRENLPAIVGMAAALEAAAAELAEEAGRLWALTDRLRAGLEERVEGVQVHGHPTQRVPHIVCWSVLGLDAEPLLMALDERGFRLDAGSTCTGEAQEPSHVLAAMGRVTTGSLRASVGPGNTEADVDALLEALPEVVGGLRQVASTTAKTNGDGG
ncbi:MAG TPA: cysteine desulfurase family protein [Actinomycetota bacterium]|nr:cysteine desulfurase family protein [Actinomycetota bacterium]